MKKSLLLLLLLPTFANASDLWLSASLVSKHSKAEDHTGYSYNSENYGLGIEYGNIMLGEYRNSFRKHSKYVLCAYTPLHYKAMQAGVAVGAVTGYTAFNNGGIAPAIVGLIKLEGEKFGTNLIITPPTQKPGVWALGLQVKMKF